MDVVYSNVFSIPQQSLHGNYKVHKEISSFSSVASLLIHLNIPDMKLVHVDNHSPPAWK